MKRQTRMDKREQSVANAIRDALDLHYGKYNGSAVTLSCALQMIAQAMKTDLTDRHYSCVQVAIRMLIDGEYLLKYPTKNFPTL